MIDLIICLICLAVGVIAYLSSSNLIIAIVILSIYLLYYFFVSRKMIKKYNRDINRIHSCYHFINSFIITFSVKESIEEAYISGIKTTNKDLIEETESLDNLKIYDRIVYLRKFFNLAIYKMFINILDMYQDQGGNILNMSDTLIREATRTEKSLTESTAIGRKQLLEFSILWGISFVVLIFLRFGISEFYSLMITSKLFISLLIIYFLLVLGSFHMFLLRFTNLVVKEDKE